MEKIIKDIIDADRNARERVAKAESERYQLSTLLIEKRKTMMQQYEEASKQKKAAYQAELEALLQQHLKESNQEYENVLKTLNERFQKEKETWIQTIYQNCLEK